MKFVFFLALKNLLRYKRRTIITTIAIAMGIAVFVIMDGFMLGLERDSERNLVWYETGSAMLMQEEYWEDYDYLPLKKNISGYKGIVQRINDMGFTATPRISFHGEIFHGYDSMQIIIHGIDTQTDDNVFKLKQTLLDESQYLQQDEPGIVIGQWLARDLKVEIGDWVDIRTRTRNGVNDVWELPVVGIINTPNPTLNKGTAFIPLSYAGEKLDMQGGITGLVVGFAEWENPESNIKKIKNTVNQDFPGLTVLSWQQVADDYLAMREAERAENVIILFLIFIIAAVGISNTMLMAVYERIK
jgi:putative ABC transport system permease protein